MSDYLISFTEIDTLLSKITASKEQVTLIDVRPPEYSQAGNIPTSINIPIDMLQDELFNLPQNEFLAKYGIPQPNKDDIIIVYCADGVRSTKAADLLSKHGYSEVKNYKGGWPDYEKNTKNSSDKRVTFLDLRTPEDSQATPAQMKCTTTSINVPVEILEDEFREVSDAEFRAKYGISRPDRDDPIIIFCGDDENACKAANILKLLGFTNIQNYEIK